MAITYYDFTIKPTHIGVFDTSQKCDDIHKKF